MRQNDLLYDEDWRWANSVLLGGGRSVVLLSNSVFSQHLTVALGEAGEPQPIARESYVPRETYIALLAAQGKPVVVMAMESGP